TLVRPEHGDWVVAGSSIRLAGGEGTASRADQVRKPASLGTGASADAGSDDRHLREITALIDPRQFDLITRPDSGPVVIQGGAGSGKTTIGLHRLAYLAYQDRRRFRPDRMLVIVFNQALARYISQVLPALDVNGVPVKTYETWAAEIRKSILNNLPKRYNPDTGPAVTRVKEDPALIAAIDAYVAECERDVRQALESVAPSAPQEVAQLLASWDKTAKQPFTYRLHGLKTALAQQATLPTANRNVVERGLRRGFER